MQSPPMDDGSPAMKRRHLLATALATAAAGAAYIVYTSLPQTPPRLDTRACSYCGMKIERTQFAAQLTVDGKQLFYDDVGCMLIHYLSFTGRIEPVKGTWPAARVEKVLVNCYDVDEAVEASSAWFVKGSDVNTPMRHGYIAFKSMTSAIEFAKSHGGDVFGWDKAVETFLKPVERVDVHKHAGEYSSVFSIELKLLDGKPTSVSQLLRMGKPVLLVFFATWCPTCSRNITTLGNAYPRFQSKATVLLTGFDPADTPAKIQRFLEQHNAPRDWIVAQPSLELIVALRVVVQETIIAINTDGEVVYEKRFGTLTEDDWLRIVGLMTES